MIKQLVYIALIAADEFFKGERISSSLVLTADNQIVVRKFGDRAVVRTGC